MKITIAITKNTVFINCYSIECDEIAVCFLLYFFNAKFNNKTFLAMDAIRPCSPKPYVNSIFISHRKLILFVELA